MNELIKIDDTVSNKIIEIRNQKIILDADVAKHYGVQTKEVNQAISRNPDKFPEGYVFRLKANELDALLLQATNSQLLDNHEPVTICDRPLTINKLSNVPPIAFTEKGLYMLATILKSPQATKATIEIVEAFAKMRELSRNIAIMSVAETDPIEPEIVESTGGLIKDLFFSHLPTTSEETSFEFNVGVMKGKRTIKSESPTIQNELNALKKRMEQLENLLNP